MMAHCASLALVLFVILCSRLDCCNCLLLVEDFQYAVNSWPTPCSHRDSMSRSRRAVAASVEVRKHTATDEKYEYAVVIDAGSSRSRFHVYRWRHVTGSRIEHSRIERVKANTLKIPHGLAKMADNLKFVRETIIRPLIVNASGIVPRRRHSRTSLYFFATAAMRLMNEERINSAMTFIDDLLRDRAFNPFRYTLSRNSRVLSGEEEGVFAWIAVNYALGIFYGYGGGHPSASAGVLEMGGLSVQIAFAQPRGVLDNLFPVSLGESRYPLYVHSHLKFGQESVDQELRRLIAKDGKDAESELINPCMLEGDTEDDPALNRTFTGTGNITACRHLLESQLVKVGPDLCPQKPCSLGSVYQPTLPRLTSFYAVGLFMNTLRTIRALDVNGVYVPEYGLKMAEEYCEKTVDELRRGVGFVDQDRYKCLRALYIYTLLTKGFGFSTNSHQILVVDDIFGITPDWSLGAVIYENVVQQCQFANSASATVFRSARCSTCNCSHAIYAIVLLAANLCLVSTLCGM